MNITLGLHHSDLQVSVCFSADASRNLVNHEVLVRLQLWDVWGGKGCRFWWLPRLRLWKRKRNNPLFNLGAIFWLTPETKGQAGGVGTGTAGGFVTFPDYSFALVASRKLVPITKVAIQAFSFAALTAKMSRIPLSNISPTSSSFPSLPHPRTYENPTLRSQGTSWLFLLFPYLCLF